MNDLVFVMHNLRLGDKQKRKIDDTSFTIEDLSSDDEWVVDKEQDIDSSNEDLLNVLSTPRDKEIVEDDDVEEIGEFLDLESHGSKSHDDLEIAIEAERGGTSKDAALEDIHMTGSATESDNDIDNNDEDDSDGDGNEGDGGHFDDDMAADDLF